jgi:hypothetical protein
MLTLQPSETVGDRRHVDDASGNAQCGIEVPSTPTACEKVVADAMRDLISGFIHLDNLRLPSRSLGVSISITLEFVCFDVTTTLKSLNKCSVEFVKLTSQQNRKILRSWGRSDPKNHRSDSRLGQRSWHRKRPSGCSRPADLELAGCIRSSSVVPTGVSSIRSESLPLHVVRADPTPRDLWVQPVAAATLDLVAANTALEALSYSAYPWGAPETFKVACYRLWSALVTLDECLGAAGR